MLLQDQLLKGGKLSTQFLVKLVLHKIYHGEPDAPVNSRPPIGDAASITVLAQLHDREPGPVPCRLGLFSA